MLCNKCGAPLRPDSAFCNRCGAKCEKTPSFEDDVNFDLPEFTAPNLTEAENVKKESGFFEDVNLDFSESSTPDSHHEVHTEKESGFFEDVSFDLPEPSTPDFQDEVHTKKESELWEEVELYTPEYNSADKSGNSFSDGMYSLLTDDETVPGDESFIIEDIDSFLPANETVKPPKYIDVRTNSGFGIPPVVNHQAGFNRDSQTTKEKLKKPKRSPINRALTILKVLLALTTIYTVFNVIVFTLAPPEFLPRYRSEINRLLGIEKTYTYDNSDLETNDSNSEPYENESNYPQDITSSFTDEDVRLLNIFLSNFAEAGIKNISSNSNYDLIDFAVQQILINTQKSVYFLGENTVYDNGKYYDRYVNSSLVEERIERFFGISGNQYYSADKFLYRDGKYYIPEDTPNVSSYFSKIDKVEKNSDGTVTVYFTSYNCKGANVGKSIYKGTGTANVGSCKKIGAGKATLESKYIGENKANYIVKKYELTEGKDYEYKNTLAPANYATAPENTTEYRGDGSLPSELIRYESGLREEGRTYRISLKEDDWNINYRSSPQLKKKGESGYNVLGKLKSGTEIYVEYIYDETWAVFYKDGEYVFASIYASNDSSQNKLMYPV